MPVIWVLHANTPSGGRSDWELFFNYDRRRRGRGKRPEQPCARPQTRLVGPDHRPDRPQLLKNRYSALIAGSSALERLLRSLDIDTILIAGTKTNVCCEATARDAMMLDFKVVMV